MSLSNETTVFGLYLTLVFLEGLRALGFNPLVFALFGMATAIALDVVREVRAGGGGR